MKGFTKGLVQHRILIIILCIALVVPSVLGMVRTKTKYDLLYYLPQDLETVQGQEILLKDFGKGAFSLLVTEGMNLKDQADMENALKEIPHVDSVIGYASLTKGTLPVEIIPDDIREKFQRGDCMLSAVFFDEGSSSEETMEAISQVRKVAGEKTFVSGLSAVVTDTRKLVEDQEAIYVAIAAILAIIVMALLLDSWMISIVFVLGIGITIIYNMGSNLFFGDLSYITKAIAAVLQLAVTMDYSIFLWHSYKEHRFDLNMDREEAMANAIAKTLTSVAGSSITTIAGFLALCFMTFTLGLNLGITMAKGVLLGVIGSVTILPALILLFEKPILKTQHKPLLPAFDKLTVKIVKRPAIWIVLFLVLLGPALFGYTHTNVYYNLDSGVPQTLPFKVANNKLSEEFNLHTELMVLSDANLPEKTSRKMLEEIKDVDGVVLTLGLESGVGPAVPEAILPQELSGKVKSDNWELMMIGTEYAVASDELNNQIDTIHAIIKKYDKKAMLIGEGPCTKDLIDVTNHDFKVVTGVSVIAIFFIIFFVLQSLSLPFILVACIELAIFINLGIPFYTGTVMSFIDSICISTIQLGATVDYAILMTTRYRTERSSGQTKKNAIDIALSTSIKSVITSALGFFAATVGVALYSDIGLISELCMLLARGALISMVIVITVLPSMFMVFDKLICRTSAGFSPKRKAQGKRRHIFGTV